MSPQYVLNPSVNRWVRLSALFLTPLTGLILALIASCPAAADSNTCADPSLGDASVQSTLRLQVHGVDWPTLYSITRITIPYKWRGAGGLLGNKTEQSSALSCFLPLDHEDYRPTQPQIIFDPATYGTPANVKIIDTVTETENPNSPQSWRAGLWSVNMQYRNFHVTFWPPTVNKVAGHGSWTVIVDAPGLTMLDPSLRPNADDGHGKVTWWFRPGKNQPSSFHAALGDKWPVRMNLSMQRWPMRWLSDGLWAIGDGVLVYAITLWMAWRLWRMRRDNNEQNNEQRKLCMSVILISSLGIACYLVYAIDDYLWNRHRSGDLWRHENLVLLAVATILFTTGFGSRWRVGALISYPVAAVVSFIASLLTWPSVNPAELIALTLPLLLAMTFTAAGAALWISRMWPFGEAAKEGCLREWENTPFRGGCRITILILVMFGASALALGQGAGAAYDDWVHRHWWGPGNGAFSWVAYNTLQETHWWIGDGLQWILYFVIATGTFAVLRAMNTSARGVFLSAHTTRGDLAVLTMVFGGWFVGTWGFYAYISIPAPFIVAVICLGGYALTRRLSSLDEEAEVKGVPEPPASASRLVTCRNALFAAAEDASNTQTRKHVRRISAPAPPAGRGSRGAPQQTVISLDPAPSASLLRRKQSYSPPQLILKKAGVDPGATALALGPAETWWDNGIEAVRAGWLLIFIPVAFDVYTFLRTGELSPLAYATGLLDTLVVVASQLVSWLAGLFTFGALLPYLRGIRSPIKGSIFGLIVLAATTTDHIIRHILGTAPYRTFLADGLIAVALFTTLGLILDFRTLQTHHRSYGLIGTLYQISTVRIAVTYATTLLVVAIGVWQNIYLTNQTAQERAQNTSNLAQYVNSQAGTGAPASGGG